MRIEADEGRCRLYLAQEHGRTELPALWLRERSPDPEQCDPTTHQRLFDPHQLPDDLAITDLRVDGDSLTIAFSDGHTGRFSVAALLPECDPSDGLPAPVAWQLDEPPEAAFDWHMVGSAAGLREVLTAFLRFGFVILRGTPTGGPSVLSIAESFGYVLETNFGRMWEVRNRPDPNDLAYRSVALAPHTDNPYREPVPGIQLLQCIVNETSGGLSTLVDGLAVTQALRAEDPKGYELLARTPVGYRFVDDTTVHFARRPMISLGLDGAFDGIHYSPRLDVTPVLQPQTMLAFHRARRRLGELLSEPRFELRFRLDPGELMMFDNIRVLHGRTSFNPNEGNRLLLGCYIDREGPRCRYRVACRSA